MNLDLYPHQAKAIERLSNGRILLGGVGSGKTRTALAFYYQKICKGTLRINGEGIFSPPKKPRDLYVITTARKRDDLDWQEEGLNFHLSTNQELSISKTKFTVDSYNNITKYTDVKNAFFIFDEQRLVGSGAWSKAFIKIAKHNDWILLSATPGDTWMDFVPVFIANGFFKNKTEFTQEHVVWDRFAKFPKVRGYYNTGPLERYRRSILVEMPFTRSTRRIRHRAKCDYDKKSYDIVLKKRWDIFKEEPIQNAGTVVHVLRKVVNQHATRLSQVRDILNKQEKRRVIIFYSFDYELDILRSLAELEKIHVAEWNGHKHEPVPLTDSWVYLVQYTAGSEAWNCTKTDTIIFYSMQYSYKVHEQCEGRIDRLNTPYKDLHYYTLYSPSSIDTALFKAIDAKKIFNERAFVKGI